MTDSLLFLRNVEKCLDLWFGLLYNIYVCVFVAIFYDGRNEDGKSFKT